MDKPSGTTASTEITEPPRSPLPSPPAIQVPVAVAARRLSAAGPVEPSNGYTPPNGANRDRAASERKTVFWLTRSDQLVLALLSAILLSLLTVHWARLTRFGTVPVEIEHLDPRQLDFRLDANSATWVEWGQLDGIGDALAHRIVADREENGPFHSIDELRRVKGIGPKTLEKLRPWLTLEPDRPLAKDKKPVDPVDSTP